MTKLENHICCSDYKTCCGGIKQPEVTADFKIADNGACEIFAPHLADVRTHTRVTSQRITKTSRSIATGKQVTSVHSFRMTTTRGWSGPGVENFSTNLNGHAELSLNLFDQIPSSGDLFGWIDNLDTFIKDQNVGFQKEKIGTHNSGDTDSRCENQISTVNSSLKNKSHEEENKNPATCNCATGAEFLNVCHFPSFSHMEASQ